MLFKKRIESNIYIALMEDVRNKKQFIVTDTGLGFSNRLAYDPYTKVVEFLSDEEAYNLWINSEDIDICP